MKHFTHPEFWKCYKRLRPEIQVAADKNFLLLKSNPNNPSLYFKKLADIGLPASISITEHWLFKLAKN